LLCTPNQDAFAPKTHPNVDGGSFNKLLHARSGEPFIIDSVQHARRRDIIIFHELKNAGINCEKDDERDDKFIGMMRTVISSWG